MQREPSKFFGGGVRTAATVASTGAAVVSILTFLHSWGVFGTPDVRPVVANFGAHWIGVRPVADTAHAIGDTMHLAATITDRNGSYLYGARPTWTSENPGIATVAQDGSVVARGAGATTIIATIGELAARTRIVVHQTVASVRIAGDSAIAIAEGASRDVVARAFDARGYAVYNRPARWRVEGGTAATVDTAGHLVASDVGRTILSANVDGVTAQTVVNVAPSPSAITLIKGGTQRATAGATLGDRIIVRVVDRRARPVEGIMVRFGTPPGSGVADPSVVVTDADGRARTSWTLGERPGAHRLLASVDHVDSALTLNAEAEPLAADTRLVAFRDTVFGVVGEATRQAAGVRVTDSAGQAFPDVPVTWIAQDGGTIRALSERTDSLGVARVLWTLGVKTGTQHLRARITGGVAPLTLLAIASASAPAKLSVERGQPVADRARAMNVAVTVKDSFGNVVPHAAVRLVPRAGSIAPGTAESDSMGRVLAVWTLGAKLGDQLLIASVRPTNASDTLVARAPLVRPASRSGTAAITTSPRIRQSGKPQH